MIERPDCLNEKKVVLVNAFINMLIENDIFLDDNLLFFTFAFIKTAKPPLTPPIGFPSGPWSGFDKRTWRIKHRGSKNCYKKTKFFKLNHWHDDCEHK